MNGDQIENPPQPKTTQLTLPPEMRQRLDSLRDIINLKRDPSYASLVSVIAQWFVNLSETEIVEIVENYITKSLEYTKEPLEERGIKVQKIRTDSWVKLTELSKKLVQSNEKFMKNWKDVKSSDYGFEGDGCYPKGGFNIKSKLLPVMVTIAILKATENAQENKEFIEKTLFPKYKLNPS